MSAYNPDWGRGRGNRGRGRGRGTSFPPTAPSFSPRGGSQPQAQNLTQSLGRLNLSSSSSNRSLLANYFEIKVGRFQELYRYELNFRKLRESKTAVTKPGKKDQTKGKGRDVPAPNPADHNADNDAGIGRAKKRRIVWLVMERLQQLNGKKPFATDYGSEVISTEKLQGENNSQTIRVEYFDEYQQGPNPDCEIFAVTLSGPAILALDELFRFLSTNTPTVTAANYQRKEETIKALNTIFSYRPYQRCFPILTAQGTMQDAALTTRNGHKFYGIMRVSGGQTTSDTGNPLKPYPSAGLDAIAGFARSVRAVVSNQGRLYLNINTTTAIFYQRTIPNTLQELIDRWKPTHNENEPWDALARHSLVNFLRGIRVRTKYLAANDNFIGKVTGLATTHPPNQDPYPRNCPMVFPDLQPNQNVASSSPSDSIIGEGPFEKTIPANCLEVIPGQVNRNITEKPRAGIRSPMENKELIVSEGRRVFFTGGDSQPGAGEFGFDLATQLARVPVVKLNQPNIRYRRQQPSHLLQTTRLPDHAIKYGSWNLRNRAFIRPASRFIWTYVELVSPQNKGVAQHPEAARFCTALQEQLNAAGMTQLQMYRQDNHACALPHPSLPRPHDQGGIDPHYNAIKSLLTKFKAKGVRLVVLLLREKNVELYSAIKRAGDQDIGVSTVCHVLTRRKSGEKVEFVPKTSLDFSGNLAMKINLKADISSVNQALDQDGKTPILTSGTMILGIDVTHPGSAAMKGAPSVAAVVGSVDDEFAQWPASLHANNVVQGDGKKESNERVVDLKDMVYARLLDYHSRNGKAPNKLIVFRDGLSEGQFEMCRTMELPRIRDAARLLLQQFRIPENEMPPIILICAVKRHNTRLFPEGNAHNDDIFIGYAGRSPDGGGYNRKPLPYNHNPLPGTLVTSDITYGEGQDFFLISQHAIQGTARPTHYVILENDTRFSRDEIAQMTHNLCYLFGRATRSVGVCPAAYYADLAADRARCYVRNVYNPGTRTNFDGGQHAFNLEVHDDMKKTMFYI